jgi:hypothetical protein
MVVQMRVHPHAENAVDFLVEHFFGEAEGGHLSADEAAGLGLVVEKVDAVTERQQVAGHGQRGRAATDEGDFLPFFSLGISGRKLLSGLL